VANVTTRAGTDRNVIIVAVRGNVDQEVAGGLRRALAGAIVRDRPRRLVIDLSGVTAIDDTGIGTLVAAWQAAGDVQIEVSLHRPSPAVAEALATNGLTDGGSATASE
jgi:anti-sigma B factor antagonist